MKRFFFALRLDALMQLRYGFYFAAAFLTLLWVALLRVLPAGVGEVATPFVVFTDLAAVGYVFVAGMVLFEKGEKTLFALVSTPLRFREYLASKLATLTLLASVMSLVVVVLGYGFRFDAALLVLGVVLASVISLLVGFIMVSPFDSISDYMVPGQLPVLVLVSPLIPFFGIWEAPVFYLVPTHGALLLLGGAFGATLHPWQVAYALLYGLLWTFALAFVARRAFDRYIVRKGG